MYVKYVKFNLYFLTYYIHMYIINITVKVMCILLLNSSRSLPQGHTYFEDVAIKALGNKGEDLTSESLSLEEEPEEEEEREEDGEQPRDPPPVQRSAIISGFNNLKKELSILSPLRHRHIIQLLGVSIKPLGKCALFNVLYVHVHYIYM